VEKISVAVRHYFGQYAEGEERPALVQAASEALQEESSVTRTPEEILAAENEGKGLMAEEAEESTEELQDAEEAGSGTDAYSDADAREEQIELDNDSVDTLVAESEDISNETIDNERDEDGRDRG